MAKESIDLDAKRATIKAALDAKDQDTEHRVYVLPRELIGRLLDYQLEKLLPSEVAAVRELLDDALGERGFPPKYHTP